MRSIAKPLHSQQGYTLVELLVALAVSAIVIAGTYAGYSFFAQQQQILTAQTEVDRNVLRAIDLFRSDVRMAGYLDYSSVNSMSASQAITIAASNPGDIILVYDDYDSAGSLYRTLIRYYLSSYTPASGNTRNRLLREWRKCNNPAAFCNLSNSTPVSGGSSGEPILDWVSSFTIQGLNAKSSGTFAGQFQTVQAYLLVQSPQKVEGSTRVVSKNFTIITRAKNVSLVP
ncbi:MAG: prepilin-type N-terminal cleavage/methylation domain-containing protein [Polynucleobacter sp.]|jgi:prepilin-type N-terminal cleavage/methylation domain-containing protein|nr:prepilin-type N-terminal cleavage/methylation domain-containing protein [Polynucleobacter sp.]